MFLNGYPYTDFHEMNLDFLLKSMEELKKAFASFTASNSLIFAEPMLHDLTSTYAKNTIVLDPDGNAYISLQNVPAGVQLSNADYWLMVFNFEEYTEKANKNFTVNYLRDTTRAPQAYAVGDWLVLDDVLYKVTVAIAADDLLEVGVNLVHFTVEQFLKDFIQTVNNTLSNYSLTIQQYKNDIDASELLYRQQLAQDIANTTASLQAQLDAAIAGATVDSEVINARVGQNYVTYATLKQALDGQFSEVKKGFGALGNNNPIQFERGSIDNTDGSNNNYEYQFRVRNVNIIRLPYDITFSTDGDLQLKAEQYDVDGSWIGDYSTWVTSITIPAGVCFRMLARSSASPQVDDFDTIVGLINYSIDYQTAFNSDNTSRVITNGEVLVYSLYEHGNIDLSGADVSYHDGNRIRTKNWLKSNCDITLRAEADPSGIIIFIKSGGIITNSGWISADDYTIPAGTEFRILVTTNKGTETSETVNDILSIVSYDYYIEGAPSVVLDNNHRLLHNGEVLIPSLFEHGNLGSDGTENTFHAAGRIRLRDWFVSQTDISIRSAPSPGGFYLLYRSGGIVTPIGWIDSGNTYTIPAGTEFRFILTLNKNAEVAGTISDIVSQFSYGDQEELPAYYFENDYLPGKLADITALYEESNKLLTFGFITDVHVGVNAGQSMKLMRYIDDHSESTPFVIFCGDVPSDFYNEADLRNQARTWVDMMNQYDKRLVLQCRGNHDYGAWSTDPHQVIYLPNDIAFKYSQNQKLTVNGDNFYYYYDVPDNTNSRIIVLDAYASTGSDGYVVNTFTQTEIDWFISALNVNKNIVVVIHCPIDPDLAYYVSAMEPAQVILDAYKTHAAVNTTVAGLSVVCDFTGNSGELICVLNGHVHDDSYHVDASGVLSITTNCDGDAISTSGYDRTVGTVNEQCFDIVTVDITNKVIYMTRIGAGSDRTFTY